MKVWVVVDEFDYEGGDPISVFSTEELADGYVARLSVNIPNYRSLVKHMLTLDEETVPYWAKVGGGDG